MITVDPDAVRAFLSLEGTPDPDLVKVAKVTEELVNSWVPESDQNKATAYGAMMLAARVYLRRNSPSGLANMGEMGPVYVSRNDPDIAMLIGLGTHRRLKVG